MMKRDCTLSEQTWAFEGVITGRISVTAIGLALFWLWIGTAQAGSDYAIIKTGIKGGGCWYDDSHFIVVQGRQPAPGQEFEVERETKGSGVVSV